MLNFTKFLAGLLVIVPMMARSGLTSDGEKYLAEAKKRIVKVEKDLSAEMADPARARAATDDLLSSKRFLDNVQKEQPKNKQAAKLQAEADKLLAKLQPTVLKATIQEHLDEVDQVLGKIEKDLSVASRDERADQLLTTRFDGVRTLVKEVLAKDPQNERALQEKQREEQLWDKYQAQREAAAKGGNR